MEDLNPDDQMTLRTKVAVVDAMAEVQCLEIAVDVKTCLHLGEKFVQRISNKYEVYDEVHIIFDRYDIQNSLKAATHTRRAGGHDSIVYRITDNTIISQLSMKRLLAHVSTKEQLSEFLAKKLIHHASTNATTLFVTWRKQVLCSNPEIETSHLTSAQEEADTKMFLHAIDATTRDPCCMDMFFTRHRCTIIGHTQI